MGKIKSDSLKIIGVGCVGACHCDSPIPSSSSFAHSGRDGAPRLRATRQILSVLFLFICSPVFAATNNFSSKIPEAKPIVIEKPAADLPLGEKLRLEVSWMGVNVGEGQIEVREKIKIHGREAYHIVATAKSNAFLSNLFPVNDEIHSYIDAKNFSSIKFRKILREGRYRADEEADFYPEQKKGIYISHKNGTQKEFEIPGPVHDPISVFYWFRLQDSFPGKKARALVSSEEKNWDVDIKVLGLKTQVIRGLGSVGTFYVEPKSSLKGVFFNRGRMWVYFTADSSRVPVWVVFKTPFGPVNAVLKNNAT